MSFNIPNSCCQEDSPFQLLRIDSLGGRGVLPPLVAAAAAAAAAVLLASSGDADEHPVGADVALVAAEAGLALAGARLAVARRTHRALESSYVT